MFIISYIDLKYSYHKQSSHLNIISGYIILFLLLVLLLSEYHTALVVTF